MRNVNRIAKHVNTPTPEEIERACRAIRSTWSQEKLQSRSLELRIDAAHTRAEAQLRFLKFLVKRAESQA